MSETKPMSFLAMQYKFLQDLKYDVSNAYNKAGYQHVGYPELIIVLEEALQKAHELNELEKGRIDYEKGLINDK